MTKSLAMVASRAGQSEEQADRIGTANHFAKMISNLSLIHYAEEAASNEARISLWSPTIEKKVRISIRQ